MKASHIGIFISSFVAGLFTSVGVDPQEEIAKALNQAIDGICPAEYGFACAISKISIYAASVVVPLIVDVLIIYAAGKTGIVSAILGFFSGFLILPYPSVGAVLMIAGMLFAKFAESYESR